VSRRAGPAALGTVLVLDGQTNQALACVRSLGRAGWRVLVASERRFPLAGWSRYCAGRFRLAGETTAAFAALRDWAGARGVAAVLPTTERSCQLCDAGRQAWEAAGIAVACAPGELLARAFNKAETLRYADAAGVRTPPTRVPGSLEECVAAGEAVGFPCVVKARFSNYWDGQTFSHTGGTHYVADAASLARVAPALREGGYWPLVQGFVPGRGCAVFALCDHGRVVLWFAHERLRDVRPSGSGSSLRRAIPLAPRLRDPAERLLQAMAWHGPAMVEFRDPGDGDPWLMEVNGRFWGSLDLAVVAGADFPRAWLDIVTGRTREPPAAYRTDVAVRWVWGDVKRFLYILAGKPAGFPGRYPTIREGLRELFGRQPPGTSSETWKSDDRWPAVGEWMQGIGELAKQRSHARAARPTEGPAPFAAEGQATSGTR
jgi:predicted ATP-grasp superfamily ATP-dependent carboligase